MSITKHSNKKSVHIQSEYLQTFLSTLQPNKDNKETKTATIEVESKYTDLATKIGALIRVAEQIINPSNYIEASEDNLYDASELLKMANSLIPMSEMQLLDELQEVL